MKRAELLTKLELVGRALSTTNLATIFQCFTFADDKVTAYNDILAITAPCEAPEPFAVNGSILLGLLRNTQCEDIVFELEEHDLHVIAGKSTFKIPFLTKEAFLFTEPADGWDVLLQLDGSLLEGVQACLMTACDDATKMALMGVCIKREATQIALYSCDGDALTKFATDAKPNPKSIGTGSCLMPVSFCEALIKTEPAKMALRFNEEWVMASLEGDNIIYGRLLKVDSPFDHEAIIKRTLKGKEVYVPIPDGLNEALSRARIVADPESGKTVLTVAKKRLGLVTETASGVVRDSIAMEKHQDVQAHVSAELMQKMLNLATDMAIMENCCVFKNGEQLFQLLSNRDD